MFEDVSEASHAVELAESAANRHGIPFYVVTHQVMSGRTMLRITSVSTNCFLEKVYPQ